MFLNSSDTFMKELARTDLVFVQKLRKFVQKILKRPDVFQQPFPFLSYSNAESSFSKRKANRKLP